MANYYTNGGKAFISGLCTGDTSKPTNYYVGWGTGTGQTATSTGLATAASEARVTATTTRQTTTVTNDTFRNVATLTCAGAGKTISEAGLFQTLASADMIVYGDFTGIALNVGDSIQFTIELKQA